MILRKWEDIPSFMRCDEVKEYYDILKRKKLSLNIKRAFDFFASILMLIIFTIPMIIIAVMIKLDSPGPVFFRQERITTYGKKFRIHKFRTMVADADKMGTAVTVGEDARITRVGGKLRDLRLDELPQLIDVLLGDMSFVGTRPEATKYVKKYTKEMFATLLMPAGITSEASIRFKDEAELLKDTVNADKVYIEEVLPEKMKYNLESVKSFNCFKDTMTMFRTILCVWGKEYK